MISAREDIEKKKKKKKETHLLGLGLECEYFDVYYKAPHARTHDASDQSGKKGT